MNDSAKVINQGLKYLTYNQQKDGSFNSFSSPQISPFTKDYEYKTVFVPALILGALASSRDVSAVKICQELAQWLIEQKNQHWSFNYWAQGEPARQTMPYPDDLDDTFCSLIGLYLYDQHLISGQALASIVKLLVSTESNPGGPYRTWLVPKDSKKAWLDIDLAVNSNIAYFLSLVSNPLPNLTKLMEKAIAYRQFNSPYYPSEYPIIYYLARAYNGPKQDELVKFVLAKQQKEGPWISPLQTALAVSALINLRYRGDLQKPLQYLKSTQHRDGSWGAEAFCLDPARQGQKHFNGSETLTTALVIEAVTLAERLSKEEIKNVNIPSGKFKDKRAINLYGQTLEAASKQLGNLDESVSSAIPRLISRLSSKKGEDIVLLPYFFYKGLKHKPQFEDEFFIKLGLANLYGWIAYTVYDDFLDEEGSAKLLPAANVAMRYSLHNFREALPEHQKFQDLVAATFDTIDGANAWETTNCRFDVQSGKIRLDKLPDYAKLDRLAERSLGHALTPVAILAASGYSLEQSEVKAIMESFRHYIIGRQLNDDLHDWEEDFSRGHITYVVREVMASMNLKSQEPTLQGLLPTMRKQFWHISLPSLCQTITQQTEMARKALRSQSLLQSSNIIIDLLDGVDEVNKETLDKVAQAEDFLEGFREAR